MCCILLFFTSFFKILSGKVFIYLQPVNIIYVNRLWVNELIEKKVKFVKKFKNKRKYLFFLPKKAKFFSFS